MQYIIPTIVLLVAVVAFFTIPSKADAQQTADTQPKVAATDKMSAKPHAATASYLTPRRKEHQVEVTLKLNGSTITDATVSYDGGKPSTRNHKAFDKAYKTKVIGQNIEEVSLSRVGGASLTTNAFNQAVEDIRKKL